MAKSINKEKTMKEFEKIYGPEPVSSIDKHHRWLCYKSVWATALKWVLKYDHPGICEMKERIWDELKEELEDERV
jgi:hypothetical protein